MGRLELSDGLYRMTADKAEDGFLSKVPFQRRSQHSNLFIGDARGEMRSEALRRGAAVFWPAPFFTGLSPTEGQGHTPLRALALFIKDCGGPFDMSLLQAV
jgi:hypothetical protein